MEEGFALKSAVTEVGQSLLRSLADLVPRVFTALVVIIIGFLLAKLVERGLRVSFLKLRVDAALERIGITAMLRQIGLQSSPSEGFGRMVYILLVVLFTQAATQSVGLTAISDAISAFFSYVPSVIAALVIALLGSLVSRAAGRMVEQAGHNAGVDYAQMLGRVVSGLIFFVVAIMAITQLRIDTAIIRSFALVLLAGAALGTAITFGLGSRDITRNLMAGFYIRKLFDIGDTLEVAGESGELVAVTPVKCILRRGEDIVAIANDTLVKEAVRQS